MPDAYDLGKRSSRRGLGAPPMRGAVRRARCKPSDPDIGRLPEAGPAAAAGRWPHQHGVEPARATGSPHRSASGLRSSRRSRVSDRMGTGKTVAAAVHHASSLRWPSGRLDRRSLPPLAERAGVGERRLRFEPDGNLPSVRPGRITTLDRPFRPADLPRGLLTRTTYESSNGLPIATLAALNPRLAPPLDKTGPRAAAIFFRQRLIRPGSAAPSARHRTSVLGRPFEPVEDGRSRAAA